MWDFKQAFGDLSQKSRRGARDTDVGVASVWTARKAIAQASQDPQESTSLADTEIKPEKVTLSPQPVTLHIPLSHSARQRGRAWWTQGHKLHPTRKSLGLLMYESKAGLLGLQVL